MIYHRITRKEDRRIAEIKMLPCANGHDVKTSYPIRNPCAFIVLAQGETKLLHYDTYGLAPDGSSSESIIVNGKNEYTNDLAMFAYALTRNRDVKRTVAQMPSIKKQPKAVLSSDKIDDCNIRLGELEEIILHGEDRIKDWSICLKHGFDTSAVFVFNCDAKTLDIYRGRNTEELSRGELFYTGRDPEPYTSSITFSLAFSAMHYKSLIYAPNVYDDERLFYPPKEVASYAFGHIPKDLECLNSVAGVDLEKQRGNRFLYLDTGWTFNEWRGWYICGDC